MKAPKDRRALEWMNRGSQLLFEGQLQAAAEHFSEALGYEDSPILQRLLGDTLAQSGRTLQALDCYQAAGQPSARDFVESQAFVQTTGLKRLACIYFYGRSGSVFLQSLLDQHPRVVTVAGAYLHDFYRFWHEFGRLPREQMLEKFLETFSPMFRADRPGRPFAGNGMVYGGELLGLTQMGPQRDQVLQLDEPLFASELARLLEPFQAVTSRYLFQAVHAAYWRALGHSLEGKDMMVFQAHFAPLPRLPGLAPATRSLRMLVDFPAARHIYTLRSPMETLSSYFTFGIRPENHPYYRTAHLAAYIVSPILLGGEVIAPGLEACSVGLRLEDLHRQGPELMRSLAGWLNIEWDESLTQSTFHGLQWWNVAHAPVVTGFNQQVLCPKKVSCFSALDRLRLRLLLAPKYRHWNYPLPRIYSLRLLAGLLLPLWILPFRMEHLSWKHRPGLSWGRALLTFAKGYWLLRWAAFKTWLAGWESRREVRVLQPEAAINGDLSSSP